MNPGPGPGPGARTGNPGELLAGLGNLKRQSYKQLCTIKHGRREKYTEYDLAAKTQMGRACAQK